MDNVIILINQKTFKLQFGMKVFRLLSKAWNIPGMNGVMARFAVLQNMADELTFEQLDVITDLILASIEANPENTETMSRDEIDDLILNDTTTIMAVIEKVMQGFSDSLPKNNVETPGKQKIAKATTKKAK
jgi:hypothetical protein